MMKMVMVMTMMVVEIGDTVKMHCIGDGDRDEDGHEDGDGGDDGGGDG